MMNNKIIFKPEKGTASYNPLIDNIKDINTQEAFAGAKRFASVLGMKFQCLRQTAKGFIKNE